MIALYDPITPMIYLGLWLLGLVILIAVAIGSRVARGERDDAPKDVGDDLHDVTERIRSKREQGR